MAFRVRPGCCNSTPVCNGACNGGTQPNSLGVTFAGVIGDPGSGCETCALGFNATFDLPLLTIATNPPFGVCIQFPPGCDSPPFCNYGMEVTICNGVGSNTGFDYYLLATFLDSGDTVSGDTELDIFLFALTGSTPIFVSYVNDYMTTDPVNCLSTVTMTLTGAVGGCVNFTGASCVVVPSL